MPRNDDWLDLAIMGVGAGAKGTVSGLVEKFLPGVGPEIGGMIAGGLLYMYGDQVHDLLPKFGAGVLIASIGGFTEGIFAGIQIPGFGSSNPGSSNPTTQVTSLEALAAAESQRSIDSTVVI